MGLAAFGVEVSAFFPLERANQICVVIKWDGLTLIQVRVKF